MPTHKPNDGEQNDHSTPNGLTQAEKHAINEYRTARDREKLDEIRRNIIEIQAHIAAAIANLQRVREYLSSVQRPSN